jgi:hypothetical protein
MDRLDPNVRDRVPPRAHLAAAMHPNASPGAGARVRKWRALRNLCLLVSLLAGFEGNAQALELPPIVRSTTPSGHISISLTPELMFGDDLPDFAVNSRLLNSLIPKISYGLHDRLQLSAYPLGFAVRLGDNNATEFIPAFALNPFLSHSPSQGATFAVNPSLSLDVRQWLSPGSALALGAMVSPRTAWIEGCSPIDGGCEGYLDALRNWYIAGQGGISHTFGRVSVAIGATVQYTFNTGLSDQDTTAFTIGSRVRHGLGSDPVLRLHLSRVTSLDLNFEYTRIIARGSGIATASMGANFVW